MNRQVHFEELDLDEIFGVEPEDEGMNFHQLFMSNYANKSFKFWVMHSNFNLSAKVLRQIADVSGIERLIPITRYRTLVNFGYLFDPGEIQKDVLKIVSNLFSSNELGEKRKLTERKRKLAE